MYRYRYIDINPAYLYIDIAFSLLIDKNNNNS